MLCWNEENQKMLLLEPNLSWAGWIFLIFLIYFIPIVLLAFLIGFITHILIYKKIKIENSIAKFIYYFIITICSIILPTLIIGLIVRDS